MQQTVNIFLRMMESKKTTLLLSKHSQNLPELHNTITKYFLELQDQRNELKILNAKLAAETRFKNDLQIDTKLYAKELTDLRNELKVVMAIVNKKQSNDENFISSVRMFVNYEQATAENHRLIQQLQTINNKLVDTMRENNDLLEKVRVLRLNQSNFNQKYAEVWKAMSALNQHLENLEANQKAVCKIHDSSRLLAMRAEKGITFYRTQLEVEQRVSKDLKSKLLEAESKVIVQNANAKTLLQSNDNSTREHVERQLFERIQKLEAELQFEKSERKKLVDGFTKMATIQQTLNNGLTNARCLHLD